MRVVSVSVSGFKSIAGSTVFELESDVTALVGKNESGKTAVLQAMHRFNPIPSGHPTDFQPLRDYPRRYYSRDEAKIPSVEPIELLLELDDSEVAAFEAKFGDGSILERRIRVSRRYASGKFYLSEFASYNSRAAVAIAKTPLQRDKYLKASYAETLDALRESDAAAATTVLEELEEADFEKQGRGWVVARLPRLQYFDEYNTLPGRVSIERLQQVEEDDLEAHERTALSLLRLAGVAQQEFTRNDYESRKAALEAAANRITDELLEYWTQNEDLSIELDIEFVEREEEPRRPPEPYLQVRVRNSRHRISLNVDERSKGFIWFFSFIAAFSEYTNEDGRLILLDEPGLNLHARAQNDLLRFFDERLAPAHQVVYSTHSLFMVHPTKLERARTVEDVTADGTSVSKDIWAARPDTVFPLLAALGIDMSQTLIIGADQLLVEGPADVAYLTVASDALQRAGGTGLDPRWTITPVGGIDKLPTFISLLGSSDLNVTVLMDGSAGGNQKLTNLVQRGLLDSKKLVPITDITGAVEADIEDLFDRDWYIGLAGASGLQIDPASLQPHPRVTRAIEDQLGGRFDHFRPASHLLRNPEMFDSISAEAKLRFQQLIDRLNSLL